MFERTTSFERGFKTAALLAGTLAVGTMVYKHFRPETGHDGGENYFHIIEKLDACIANVEYVMLGGGASAALMDPRTQLDSDNRRIIPPPDIEKDQYRTNGRKADVDLLVISADPNTIKAVRTSLEPNRALIEHGTEKERAQELAKPGARLKIGVTGLAPGESYDVTPVTAKDKLLHIIKKDWISHRLQYEDGSRMFAMSDIRVKLPEEYFEPWLLELKNGTTIPTLHPLIQVLCYLSRASHGIRRRDIEKVSAIMEYAGPQFGASLQWREKNQTASLILERPVNAGVTAAVDACEQKNHLRWKNTKERQGTAKAALLAARMAVHRQLDTREFFIQFGQGGLLFNAVLSRFSGESQTIQVHE